MFSASCSDEVLAQNSHHLFIQIITAEINVSLYPRHAKEILMCLSTKKKRRKRLNIITLYKKCLPKCSSYLITFKLVSKCLTKQFFPVAPGKFQTDFLISAHCLQVRLKITRTSWVCHVLVVKLALHRCSLDSCQLSAQVLCT